LLRTLTFERLSGETFLRWLRWTGIVTTLSLFVVIAMGDLVTTSGSAEGCGRSWPLCHGQFVPIFTLQTLIEFSHRVVVAVVSVGVVALAVGILVRKPRRWEMLVLAPALVIFLVVQAVLGGFAVLWPQSPPILALHMGVSLLSFTTALLTTTILVEERGVDALRDVRPPSNFRVLVWGSFLYLYALIYVGAFVRHSQADLACAGWPLCNGALVPSLDPAVIINLLHRVAALAGLGLFFILFWNARRLRAMRPDLYWASLAALILLLLQGMTGALLASLGMPLWTALLHGATITPVFGAVSYLCLHVLPRGIPPLLPLARTRESGIHPL
jgi:cytochrome c oxidase assembly protein subunit 15